MDTVYIDRRSVIAGHRCSRGRTGSTTDGAAAEVAERDLTADFNHVCGERNCVGTASRLIADEAGATPSPGSITLSSPPGVSNPRPWARFFTDRVLQY